MPSALIITTVYHFNERQILSYAEFEFCGAFLYVNCMFSINTDGGVVKYLINKIHWIDGNQTCWIICFWRVYCLVRVQDWRYTDCLVKTLSTPQITVLYYKLWMFKLFKKVSYTLSIVLLSCINYFAYANILFSFSSVLLMRESGWLVGCIDDLRP